MEIDRTLNLKYEDELNTLNREKCFLRKQGNRNDLTHLNNIHQPKQINQSLTAVLQN